MEEEAVENEVIVGDERPEVALSPGEITSVLASIVALMESLGFGDFYVKILDNLQILYGRTARRQVEAEIDFARNMGGF